MLSFFVVAILYAEVAVAAVRDLAYQAVRQEDNCVFPINLLLLQDVTGSMQEAFAGTAAVTLPALNSTVPEQHPGSTFSLAIFKDKPIISLGEEGDFCYETHVLGSDTPMDFEPLFSSYIANGGWDWAENQFGAIVALLNSPRSFPWTAAGSLVATNLIVMVTDAGPHFEGDSAQSRYPQLAPWGDSFDEDLADEYCRNRYYPSAATVRNALRNAGAYLGQIIINPELQNGRALSVATWFNEYLGQPADFVLGNYENTTNWLSEITSILSSLSQSECNLPTTSTPIPNPSVTGGAFTLTLSQQPPESNTATSLMTGAPPPTLLSDTAEQTFTLPYFTVEDTSIAGETIAPEESTTSGSVGQSLTDVSGIAEQSTVVPSGETVAPEDSTEFEASAQSGTGATEVSGTAEQSSVVPSGETVAPEESTQSEASAQSGTGAVASTAAAATTGPATLEPVGTEEVLSEPTVPTSAVSNTTSRPSTNIPTRQPPKSLTTRLA